MKDNDYRHVVDILFVLGLFCIFVLSAIFLISIGADIYSGTMANMDSNFNSRTAVAYVTEKIHQSDEDGAVYIGKFDDVNAIVIKSNVKDTDYYTYIYEYDGKLKELTVREDLSLGKGSGQDIIEVEYFDVEYASEDLIRCSVKMPSEEMREFYVAIHSGGILNE